MWDLASYVSFLRDQVSAFGNGLAAYAKLRSN